MEASPSRSGFSLTSTRNWSGRIQAWAELSHYTLLWEKEGWSRRPCGSCGGDGEGPIVQLPIASGGGGDLGVLGLYRERVGQLGQLIPVMVESLHSDDGGR